MAMSSVPRPALRSSADISLRRPLEFVATRRGTKVIGTAGAHRGGSGMLRVDGHTANRVPDLATGRRSAVPAALVAAHHVRATAVAHHKEEKAAPQHKPGKAL